MKTPNKLKKISGLTEKFSGFLKKIPGLNKRKNTMPFKTRVKQKTNSFDRRTGYFLVEEKIRIIPIKEKEKNKRENRGSPAYTDLNGKRRTINKVLSIKNSDEPYKKQVIQYKDKNGKSTERIFLTREIWIKTDRRSEEGSKIISDRRKTGKKKE